MREIKTEKQLVEQDVVVEEAKVCNRCGRRMVKGLDDPEEGAGEFEESLSVEYGGGWWNTTFGDMNYVEFDLCQHCLREFVRTFAIPPKTTYDYDEALRLQVERQAKIAACDHDYQPPEKKVTCEGLIRTMNWPKCIHCGERMPKGE
jgi:ribosomal protein S14